MNRFLIMAVSMIALLASCRDLNYYANGYVKDVTLNANHIELVLGEDEDFKLDATISPLTAPNRKLIWSSSNWSVAEVNDKGLVTPKSVGRTIITVKTDDGGHTDRCEVEVVTKSQEVN